MKSNRLGQQPSQAPSLLTQLVRRLPTHLLLYSLALWSILTLLYLTTVHLIFPATSPTIPLPTASPSPTVAAGCEVGGCSGQLCRRASSSSSMFSSCEWSDEYRCYQQPFAVCSPSVDSDSGGCEWQTNEQMQTCLATARSSGRDGDGAGVQ